MVCRIVNLYKVMGEGSSDAHGIFVDFKKFLIFINQMIEGTFLSPLLSINSLAVISPLSQAAYRLPQLSGKLIFLRCVQQSWTTLTGGSPVTVIASEPCS